MKAGARRGLRRRPQQTAEHHGRARGLGKTFAAVLIIVLAITVMQLVLRFMRIATAELVGDQLP